MKLIPLLLLLASTPALAETSVPAEEFQQLTEGRTYFYGLGTEPYGAEEYLPNRRVRWSFLDGQCQNGHWYEENGLICFVYDEEPVPQCWSFHLDGGRIVAQFENDPAQTTLYEMHQSAEPLLCLGPEVGA